MALYLQQKVTRIWKSWGVYGESEKERTKETGRVGIAIKRVSCYSQVHQISLRLRWKTLVTSCLFLWT